MPAKAFDRAEILKCIREQGYREPRELLGAGSFGVAYVVCEKAPFTIGVLVKVLVRDSIDRELYIYEKLGQAETIAPRLDKTWECNGARYFALQRFSGNMEALGRNQLASKRHEVEKAILAYTRPAEDKKLAKDVALLYTQPNGGNMLYTEAQMKRMFEVAYELGRKYHVLHGDLKPDNLLYDDKTGQIVATDFGLSGYYDPYDATQTRLARVGWPRWLTKGCPSGGTIIYEQELLGEYNAWQLASYFGAIDRATYVLKENGSYSLFRIHYDSPRTQQLVEKFGEDCRTSNNRLAEDTQEVIDAVIHLPPYYAPLY